MKLGAVLSASFVILVFGEDIIEHYDANNYASLLEGNVSIEWSKPIFKDEFIADEHLDGLLSEVFWKCAFKSWSMSTKIVNRRTLVEQSDARIYHTVSLDYYTINNSTTALSFAVQKSETIIDTTTKGWNAAAGLSAKGISLAGGYSDHTTSGTWTAKSINTERDCPGDHACRAETWTLHLQVSGKCRAEPMLKCGSTEISLCQGTWSMNLAEELREYRQRYCKSQYNKNQHEVTFTPKPQRRDCEIRKPVMQEGRPVTIVVHPPDIPLTAQEVPKADEVVENGWYKLTNGELYSLKHNNYWSPANGSIYEKSPDTPRPDLSKFVPPKDSYKAKKYYSPLKAISKGKKYYLLESGEYYDAAENKFCDISCADRWFLSMPGAIKPDLTNATETPTTCRLDRNCEWQDGGKENCLPLDRGYGKKDGSGREYVAVSHDMRSGHAGPISVKGECAGYFGDPCRKRGESEYGFKELWCLAKDEASRAATGGEPSSSAAPKDPASNHTDKGGPLKSRSALRPPRTGLPVINP